MPKHGEPGSGRRRTDGTVAGLSTTEKASRRYAVGMWIGDGRIANSIPAAPQTFKPTVADVEPSAEVEPAATAAPRGNAPEQGSRPNWRAPSMPANPGTIWPDHSPAPDPDDHDPVTP